MISQPNAPQQASIDTLANKSVRAHIATALRKVADQVDHPGSGPITIQMYGRMIQITVQDVTDQQ